MNPSGTEQPRILVVDDEPGAYDYITKPINFDYLELSILTRLAQRDLALYGHRDPVAGGVDQRK